MEATANAFPWLNRQLILRSGTYYFPEEAGGCRETERELVLSLRKCSLRHLPLGTHPGTGPSPAFLLYL